GVIADPALDGLHAADPAVADQFAGQAEAAVELRALLAAGLQSAVGLVGDADQRLALVHGQGQRLFAVHVLAGAQGGDGDQRVPVVGRGHGDGGDVAAGQEFAEVVELRDLAAGDNSPRPRLAVGAVHVAAGDVLHPGDAGGLSADVAAAAVHRVAAADVAHHDG